VAQAGAILNDRLILPKADSTRLPLWQKVKPILIVDDEQAAREVVRQTLMRAGYAVLEATTGREGVRLWQRYQPSLVILDILIPEMNGWQVLAQIRQQANTPIVMLTRKSGEDDKVRAFELGADDYLSKPFNNRELLVRIQAVLRRTQSPTAPGQPGELVVGDLHLDLDTQRVRLKDRIIPLSAIEFQILLELARVPGRLLSREQLVSAIWGAGYCGNTRVLRCAIYRLRQKLAQDATQSPVVCGRRYAGYWLAAPGGLAAPERLAAPEENDT
jgi:DNA-binding response OmpR family regulator